MKRKNNWKPLAENIIMAIAVFVIGGFVIYAAALWYVMGLTY